MAARYVVTFREGHRTHMKAFRSATAMQRFADRYSAHHPQRVIRKWKNGGQLEESGLSGLADECEVVPGWAKLTMLSCATCLGFLALRRAPSTP